MHLILISLLGLVGLDRSATALKEYVAKEDTSYKWEVRATQHVTGADVVQIQMTSQTWKDTPWKHFIYIIKPEKLTTSDHALLCIAGGGWRPEFDQPAKDKDIDDVPGEAMVLARQAGMPVIAITHVPFQPMFDGLVEDEIISLTFLKYLQTRDATWPLLFPMVKAAVRAMDTAQAYSKKEWSLDIKGFSVFGASKRGWTTWLTAASGDPRVKAIMPIVIDTLNMPAQMKHQLESYGEYSDQIKDYTEKGIQQQMETSVGRELNAMVDPYSYRKLLTLPKLIINGTNDPYWTLDSLNRYWDELTGPKYIFYAPNGGHGLTPEAIVRLSTTAIVFAKAAAGQLTLPKLTWNLEEKEKGLEVSIKSDLLPAVARAWTAHSDTRDFRKAKWDHVHMETKDDAFTYELPRPASGYSAVYGEAKYFIDNKPVYLCTNVRIIPAKETKE